MKRLILMVVAAVFSAVVWAWKPIFVGHRGCGNGVENTVEAYRYGVSHYGYAGLECDVKVSSDGQYIISHDNTTTRLGGQLDVNQSTLEQLQKEMYIQQRYGLTYAGKICTVSEFLAICKELNVFPIIELKWANGINNDDMSAFSGLVDLIKQYDMMDRAIILTSMRGSLEYILQHYPELHLQYLMMEMTEEKIDWCIQNKVTPSCAHTGITATQVRRCHEAGLQVAAWTVNKQEDYDRIVKLGVGFVTTDILSIEQPEMAPVDWENIKDEH